MSQIGLETWRGAVGPWHIDQMGHMNVRFYAAIGMEAMAGLAGALGMPRAFTAGATSTLAVRDLHIRFLHEARLAAGLHMECAVLEMGETDARILQVLFHSASGLPAAALTTRVEHLTPHVRRPFPWSSATRRLAEGVMGAAPDYALPRGLTGDLGLGEPSLARADALGLQVSASGALSTADCDVFGLMKPDHVLARISDAMPHQIDRASLPLKEYMPDLEGHLGGATVEFRARYHRWPQAGDRLVQRSGMAAVTSKTTRLVHWLLDPAGGEAWTEAEMITVNLDLQARKAVELPGPIVDILKTRLIGAGTAAR